MINDSSRECCLDFSMFITDNSILNCMVKLVSCLS